MKVIDFRFRPNTPEIINGIKNSTMFKAACEVIGFDQRKPQPLDEIVADLDAMGVELGVITGRDAETTYGFPANNNSVLEFCRAYPNKFVGLWGIDPHKKMAAVREIEKVVKEYGMKGIAIDPYLAHMPASDARFYPYTPSAANWMCPSSSSWLLRRACPAPSWNTPTPATWTRSPVTSPN